ncbi:chorion peroxidase-like [Mizuhopecten yessoensis]|uniref:chorion peroxidase-like n=1 Tax=Mizuhopecten yessoensis TaxID=6573 RepID=UPI000B45DB1E|nr:chorion peroxidase-like [Mizuhopecten yessoensis]
MAFLFEWSLYTFLICGFLRNVDGAASIEGIIREAFDKGEQAKKHLYEFVKPNFHQYDVSGSAHNCRWQMGLLMFPTPTTLYMEKHAVLYLAATRHIAEALSLSPAELQSNAVFIEEWQRVNTELNIAEEGGCEEDSPAVKRFCELRRYARFRTADGLCNNIDHPTWGRSHTPHARLLPPVFGDALNLGDVPRITSINGSPLPGAREVSVKALRHYDLNVDPKYTHFVMAFGQFLDHDLTLTPESKGTGDTNIHCCIENPDGTLMERPECFPIPVPPGDPYYTSKCINFVRSAPAIQTGCGISNRETLNQITHFVDGSNVYGSSESETAALRHSTGGLMKTDGNNMPPAASDDECVLPANPLLHCLKTGDVRSNEILNLGLLHTVFLREHNRIAKNLQKKCRRFRKNSNRLFEETRRILIGILQDITFYEFLPEVLGSPEMRKHRLESNQYRGYNPNVNPSILNEFSTAAYRFGHSMILDKFKFLNEDYSTDFEKPVSETFFQPIEIQDHDQATKLTRFLATGIANNVDREFAPAIQDTLFQDDENEGFDLPAANIQRGRDHGLPSYMAVREACGLTTVSTFDTLPDHVSKDRTLLANTYNNVEDVDLFAGGITETHVEDGLVGPTFACIIGKQFSRLKVGDSHYFERRRGFRSYKEFTTSQIKAIRRHTLAKVLCENTGLKIIQRKVFGTPDCVSNPTLDCSMIPDIDFRKFC